MGKIIQIDEAGVKDHLYRGIEGVRVLQGFLSLSKKYPAHGIDLASRTALQAGMFRLRPLKELIKRNTDKQQLEFTDSHPIIRPLSEYQNLISVSFRKECP